MYIHPKLTHLLSSSKPLGYLFSLVRIYYGYNWLIAGFNKITSDFSVVGFFNYFVLSETSVVMSQATKGEWGASIWVWFVENLFIPFAPILNTMIPLTELALGILLLIGFQRIIICVVACFLNITFIMSGVVWPGVHYLFFQLLLAVSNNQYELCVDNYLRAKQYKAVHSIT
ncbi:hypothetical protein [Photobacterium sp. DNB22_13_2]